MHLPHNSDISRPPSAFLKAACSPAARRWCGPHGPAAAQTPPAAPAPPALRWLHRPGVARAWVPCKEECADKHNWVCRTAASPASAPVAVAGAAACARRWRSPSFSLCSAELMAVSVASFPSNDLTLAGRVRGGREGRHAASVGCRWRRRVGGGSGAGKAVGPPGRTHYIVHAMQWRGSAAASVSGVARLTFFAAPCAAPPRRPP